MVLDIVRTMLESADDVPRLCGILAERIREMTGSRFVFIIRCFGSEKKEAHEVIVAVPQRRKDWLKESLCDVLIDRVHRQKDDRLRILPLQDVPPEFMEKGVDNVMFFPLSAGNRRIGALLALGVPKPDSIAAMREHLAPLAKVAALAMRSSLKLQDITDALKKKEYMYSQLFEWMLDGFALHQLIYDANGRPCDYRFLTINPAFEELTGLRRDEVAGKRVKKIMPDTEQYWIDIYGKVVRTGESIRFENYSSELEKWFEVHAFKSGENQFACIFQDVTERYNAMKALAASEKRLRSIVDRLPHRLVSLDKQMHVRFANDFFLQEFGQALEEVVGQHVEDVIGKERLNMFREYVMAALAGKDCSSAAWLGGEIQGRHLTGKFVPDFSENGEVIGCFVLIGDDTEQVLAHERSLQSRKMEALGVLAGGIAHDFNNVLQGILGYTQLVYDRFEGEQKQKGYLKKVLDAADRAKDMINQVMLFTRQKEAEKVATDLRRITLDVLSLLRTALPSNIRLENDVESGVPRVMVDPTQMHQVLMNLGTNAFHAMDGNGTLTVGLNKITIEAADNDPVFSHGEEVVEWTVADTGCGMSPEIQSRIFDPFFTTKKVGEGVGMGLATVHGIIARAEGSILVESEEGKGTVFRIHLPICEKQANGEQHDMGGAQDVQRGTYSRKSILIVDDEEILTEMICDSLEDFNFDLAAFNDPLKALEEFQTEPSRWDLLLTDLTMPGINGIQLIKEVKTVRNDLPAVMMSGYCGEETKLKAVNAGATCFLDKPVSPGKLAAIITQLLNQ